jgi:hypothetical protein
MNDVPARDSFCESLEFPQDSWSKLLRLAQMLEFDATGGLVVRNGKSRLLLRADGTIRIEGTRIVQTAERNISFDAATIELN